MKKTATLVTIIALAFSAVTVIHVKASEVSGTISTDQQTTTDTGTNTGTGTTGGTSTTTDQGHSSEISGQLGTGGSTNTDTNQITGTVGGGSENSSGDTTDNTVHYYASSGGGSGSQSQSSTGGESNSTSGISDEEAAHLALTQFGPRYGLSDYTPGAPTTGGDYSSLSVGSGSSGSNETSDGYDKSLFPDSTSYDSPFAYVARSGEGPVIPAQEASAIGALQNASGLSMMQLALIAIIGLVLLGSMGYAISRSGNRLT